MVQKIISFADDPHLYLNNLLTMFYPSKILLFGEYTVISGSDALALPLDKFRGCWNYRAEKPERVMLDFAEYLKIKSCLLYTSPSPRDRTRSRMPSSA